MERNKIGKKFFYDRVIRRYIIYKSENIQAMFRRQRYLYIEPILKRLKTED